MLGRNLAVTSYHFSPMVTDSALVIEAENTVILNVNDAKFMGWPLAQILDNHPRIDFALRSHSSANGRQTYRYLDAPNEEIDDIDAYARAFCSFMYRVKPRYAVPFASNHCHLHRDTWRYNAMAVSPTLVANAFTEFKNTRPFDTELKVMTSGDFWDSETGFHITPSPYLADRDRMLVELAEEKRPILERYYEEEKSVKVTDKMVQKFFDGLFRAVPSFMLRRFRGKPILLESVAGDHRDYFLIDPALKAVRKVQPDEAHAAMMRMVMPASVLKQSLMQNMFSHAAISKRVSYIATKADMPHLQFFAGNLLPWYEYQCLPLGKLLTWRTLASFARRWREVVLYMQMSLSLVLGRSLREQEQRLLIGTSLPLSSSSRNS